MATEPKIKLTNRDFDTLRKALVARIPDKTDKFTDFQVSDPGMTLLELFTALIDYFGYYQDIKANEVYLPTVKERANALKLVKLIGYQPKEHVPAITTVTFSIASTHTLPVLIPRFTRVSTANPRIEFATVEDSFIPAGEDFVDVTVKQGVVKTETFISSGDPDQSFQLNTTHYGHDTAYVEVDGEPWTLVETFVDSLGESEDFRVETDEDLFSYVMFGDGISGKVPSQGSSIEVTYLETSGEEGNIGAERIIKVLDPGDIQDSNGQVIDASVSNAEGAVGGAPPETVLQIKKQAPASFKTLERAVTKEDFVALAEEFPGIKQAKAIDLNDFELKRDDQGFIIPLTEIDYFQIQLVVVPDGGQYASQALKNDLAAFLEEKRYVTSELFVVDPEYVPIDVHVEVHVLRSADNNEVISTMTDTIHAFFKPSDSPQAERRLSGVSEGTVIGEDVILSKLIFQLQDIPGVGFVNIVNPSGDVNLSDRELATLGVLNITVAGEV